MCTKMFSKLFLTAALVLALSLLVPGIAGAASYTWSTTTSSNSWTTTTNWTPNGNPGASSTSPYSDAVFIGSTFSVSPVLSSSAYLTGVTITGSSSGSTKTPLDINASGLLGMQGAIALGTGHRTLSIEGTLRNDGASGTPYTISGSGTGTAILLNDGGTISSQNGGIWNITAPITSNGTTTISSPITGTGAITASTGTLTINGSANSTLSGTLTSSSGATFNLGAVGKSGGITNNGTMNFNGTTYTGVTGTYNATIWGGTGAFNVVAANPFTLINNIGFSNYSTMNVLSGATFRLSSAVYGGYGTVTGGGNITLNSGSTLDNYAGNSSVNQSTVTMNAAQITNSGGGTFTFSDPISGTGTVSGVTAMTATTGANANGGLLTVIGAPGTLGTSLGNSYGSGTAMITNGVGNTLDLQGTFDYIEPVNIAPNGGTVQLDGATFTTALTWGLTLSAGTINVTNNSSLAGPVSSDANVTILSGKTLSIIDNLVNSGTNVTVSNIGSIIGGNVSVASNAKLTSSGVLQIDALSGGGTLAVTGGTAALTQKGTSWPTNSAAVQNIGMLTISGGSLDVTNNLINVNYGAATTPYSALALQVNSAVITQSTVVPYRTVGIYDTASNLDGTTPGGTTVRLGYASPGDTMLRGKVDSSDIINILSAGKYGIGPSNARWDQGDFDHNGTVDSSDIIAILASGVYSTGPYNSPVVAHQMLVVGGPPSSLLATVIYNAASGDVEIDPNGNTMTGFRLRDSAGNFFVASAAFPPGGAFTTDTAAEKFWSTFSSSSYLTSVFDLGNIAPANLTDAAFMAAMNNLSGDSVWTKAGGGSFDYNFISVPEPSSLILGMLGVLGLSIAWLRRKRAEA